MKCGRGRFDARERFQHGRIRQRKPSHLRGDINVLRRQELMSEPASGSCPARASRPMRTRANNRARDSLQLFSAVSEAAAISECAGAKRKVATESRLAQVRPLPKLDFRVRIRTVL